MRRRRSLLGTLWVLLLVATGCTDGGLGTPADSLDDDELVSTFGYVVGELPGDYELCAVSVPSALSLRADESASFHVYGDGSLDDPYTGPLFGVALFEAAPIEDLDLGETTSVEVQGNTALLGDTSGSQLAVLPADAGSLLTWQAGNDRVLQLMVRNADDADASDLVRLADAVRVNDGAAQIDVARLPDGFVDLGDLYQLEGRPQFRFSLDHQRRGADDLPTDQMTLLGSQGDAASMEAFRFRASESSRVNVGGRLGVGADIGAEGEGPWVVSWLQEDDLILRLFSFELQPEQLLPLAESVRRVDGGEWSTLQDDFGDQICGV